MSAASFSAVTAGVLSLRQFVLHTFLWLPPCSAVWYGSAQYYTIVVGWLARQLAGVLTSDVVSALERSGQDLVFITVIKVQPEPGQTALLTPEVNPLFYTYGLVLFVALMLAERARWWKIPLGAVILLPFQSWGIAFDFLAQVGIQAGPDVSAQAGLFGWRLVAVAVGYQLGALIFPSLVPVILWAILGRLFIVTVRGARAASGQFPPV